MISYVNEIFEGGNVYELTLENGYNPNLLPSGPRGCGHLHLPPYISICHRDRMIPYVNTLFEGRTLCEIHTIKRLYSTKNPWHSSTAGLSITAHTLVVEAYFLLPMITWALGNPLNAPNPPLGFP
jgi:hypothetical protein